MSVRLPQEVEARFASVASALDEALAAAEWEGVERRDESNRVGFDKTGFGAPTWSYAWKWIATEGSPRATAEVRVRYVEPIVGTTGEPLVTWRAQVFEIGNLPFYVRSGESRPRVEALAGDGMAELVRAGLLRAFEALPRDIGLWLQPPP